MGNGIFKLAWFLAFISAWVMFLIWGYRWCIEIDVSWAMKFWLSVSAVLLGIQIWILFEDR